MGIYLLTELSRSLSLIESSATPLTTPFDLKVDFIVPLFLSSSSGMAD